MVRILGLVGMLLALDVKAEEVAPLLARMTRWCGMRTGARWKSRLQDDPYVTRHPSRRTDLRSAPVLALNTSLTGTDR